MSVVVLVVYGNKSKWWNIVRSKIKVCIYYYINKFAGLCCVAAEREFRGIKPTAPTTILSVRIDIWVMVNIKYILMLQVYAFFDRQELNHYKLFATKSVIKQKSHAMWFSSSLQVCIFWHISSPYIPCQTQGLQAKYGPH